MIVEMMKGESLTNKNVEYNEETLFYAKFIVDDALDYYTNYDRYKFHNQYSNQIFGKNTRILKELETWQDYCSLQLKQLSELKQFLKKW